MCSGHGNVKTKLSLSERVYSRSNCGLRVNQDVNAAINISHIAKRSGGNLPREFGNIGIERRSHFRPRADTARASHVNMFWTCYNTILVDEAFVISFYVATDNAYVIHPPTPMITVAKSTITIPSKAIRFLSRLSFSVSPSEICFCMSCI